jgi:phage tail sheath gpL-like
MSSSTVSQPNIVSTLVSAQTKQENAGQKILFVGQKLASGTATSGELVENVGLDRSTFSTLFGEGGYLYHGVDAFRNLNDVNQVDVIPLDPAGGATAATATLEFTGTATTDGTYTLYLTSASDYALTIPVLSGDTAEDIGDAVVAAVTSAMPVTAANVSGLVTFTAKDVGTEANAFSIRIEGTALGVTPVLSAFSGGATDPDLTGVFDPVLKERYQTIVWPASFDISEVKYFLISQEPADNKITDGVAIIATNDTFSNLLTLGNTYNEKQLVVFGQKKVVLQDKHVGSSLVELDFVRASRIAALRSKRLTDGEPISDIVISTFGLLDATGGTALASMPYFNTPVSTSSLVFRPYGFDGLEQEQLKDAGVTFEGNNIPKTSLILDEVVTTYKTDNAGNPDISFKYLNYVDTSSNVREYFFNNQKSRYAQSRLTNGDLIGGRTMANESSIRAYLIELYTDLSGQDFVLTQAGEDALTFFKNNLTVTVDLANGSVTETMKTPIVTQLREIVQTIQIAFSTSE